MAAIDTIINMGDDQQTNQFQILFPAGIPFGGSGENVALRMDQSIDIPEDVVNSYDIFYKGMKIPKTGTLDESTKEISIPVRIDQQWAVWDDLYNWKKKVYDSNEGTRASSEETRTPMIIQALDGSDSVVKTHRFTGVQIKSIKVGAYEHGGSEPMRAELTFIFAAIEHE